MPEKLIECGLAESASLRMIRTRGRGDMVATEPIERLWELMADTWSVLDHAESQYAPHEVQRIREAVMFIASRAQTLYRQREDIS